MEKMEKNHHFWEFSRFGTGTKDCGTGTTCDLVDWYRYLKVDTSTQCSILDQRSCFCHNVVIYYLN